MPHPCAVSLYPSICVSVVSIIHLACTSLFIFYPCVCHLHCSPSIILQPLFSFNSLYHSISPAALFALPSWLWLLFPFCLCLVLPSFFLILFSFSILFLLWFHSSPFCPFVLFFSLVLPVPPFCPFFLSFLLSHWPMLLHQGLSCINFCTISLSHLPYIFCCLSSFILSPIFSPECLPFLSPSLLFLLFPLFASCFGHIPAQCKWKQARF